MSLLLEALLTPVTAPLSWGFAGLLGIRDALYSCGILYSYRSKLPVISIGNITVGGNGKTPLAIKISEILSNIGYHPVILSRGYGGRENGPSIVLASDSAKWVGDEPKLMAARGCVVVVAKNKKAGVKFIESRGLGDIIVLDDGFQSRYLKRDIDLISIEVSQPSSVKEIVTGRLLPWGRLREPLSAIRKRASALVFNVGSIKKKDASLHAVKSVLPHELPMFEAQVVTQGVFGMVSSQVLTPQRVNLITSIARPEKVVDSLEYIGFKVERKFYFPDHHEFKGSELEAILMSSDYPVVCTEKDAVKLSEYAALNLSKIFVSKIDLLISPEIGSYLNQKLHRI
jgi:tetraacyldisaccharide 4'-kinase